MVRRVGLVGVALVLEHDGRDTSALAGAGVAQVNGANRSDGRLHEVADSGIRHVGGEVRDDDLLGISRDGLGRNGGSSTRGLLGRSRLGRSSGVTSTRATGTSTSTSSSTSTSRARTTTATRAGLSSDDLLGWKRRQSDATRVANNAFEKVKGRGVSSRLRMANIAVTDLVEGLVDVHGSHCERWVDGCGEGEVREG